LQDSIQQSALSIQASLFTAKYAKDAKKEGIPKPGSLAPFAFIAVKYFG